MPVNNVNIGGSPNDGTGDPLRDAFQKLNNNDNFLDTTIDDHMTDTNNPHSVTATQTNYDNSSSGLSATTVKVALDELSTLSGVNTLVVDLVSSSPITSVEEGLSIHQTGDYADYVIFEANFSKYLLEYFNQQSNYELVLKLINKTEELERIVDVTSITQEGVSDEFIVVNIDNDVIDLTGNPFNTDDVVIVEIDIKNTAVNPPQYIRQFFDLLALTTTNTWRGWTRNSSNMLILQPTSNYGTGATPTFSIADVNKIIVKNALQLKGLTMYTDNATGGTSDCDLQLYVISYDYDETNMQVLINEPFTNPVGVGNFVHDFTIESHVNLSENSIVTMFIRILNTGTSTTTTFQSAQFYWKFDGE